MRSQEELWAEEFSELFPKAKELDAKALAVLRDFYGPAVIEIGRSFQPDEDELELAFKKSFAKTVRESDASISENSFKQILFSNMKLNFENKNRDQTGQEVKSSELSSKPESGNKAQTLIIGVICLIMGFFALASIINSRKQQSIEIRSDPDNIGAFVNEVLEKAADLGETKDALDFLQNAYNQVEDKRIKDKIDVLESSQYKVVEHIWYDIYDNGANMSHKVYQYDEAGFMLEETAYDSFDNVKSQITYDYNSDGCLTGWKKLDAGGNLLFEFKADYDEDNRPVHKWWHDYSDCTERCEKELLSEYDDSGNLKKKSCKIDGQLLDYYEMKYDSDGNQTEENYINLERDNNFRSIKEWDSESHLIKEILYLGDVLDEWSEMTYRDDLLIKCSYKDQTGRILYWIDYEYDDAARRVCTTVRNDSGSEVIVDLRKYDKMGNAIEVYNCTYDTDNLDIGLSASIQREYNSDGMLKRVKYNDFYGEPPFTLDYLYDEKNRVIKVDCISNDPNDSYVTEYRYEDFEDGYKKYTYRTDSSHEKALEETTEYQYIKLGNKYEKYEADDFDNYIH